MSSWKRRLWKILAATVAAMVILLAVGVGLFRAALPYMPQLSLETERAVEQALGWPLRIGSMDLRWQFIGPMLVLEDVELLAPGGEKTVISVSRIDLVFRPGDLFQESDYRPSHIRLHEPRFGIRRDADGRIWLSGELIELDPEARLDWRTLLRRVLKHGRLSVIDGNLQYQDVPLGIDNWEFRDFNVSVASDGEEHEFVGSFLPPGPLGEQAAFDLSATGEPGKPEAWEWRAHLGARQVGFNWLYEQIRWAGPGRFLGTLDISGELSGSGIDKVQGSGSIAVGGLDFIPADPRMSAVRPGHTVDIAFDWIAEFGDSGAMLDLEQLVVVAGDSRWPATDWHVAVSGEDGARRVEARASYLRLQDILGLRDGLPTDAFSEDVDRALLALQPRGDIEEFRLAWREGAGLEQLAFHGNDIGVDAWEGYPGLTGIDVVVDAAGDGGSVELATRSASVDLRPLFRDPFVFRRIDGRLGWQHGEDVTVLEVAALELENSDAGLKASGRLEIPAGGAIAVSLRGSLDNAQVTATPTYLPVDIMEQPLIDWLDAATPAGVIPEAQWVLEGPLQDFPWADGGGIFDIRFEMQDFTLRYDADWPQVTGRRARVHFHQQALDVEALAATSSDISLAGVKASIADLREGDLHITGPVQGDAHSALDFLAATPLRDDLSGLLDTLELSGPFAATLDLDLPLTDLESSRIDIRSRLDGVRADVVGVPWPATGLRGDIDITRNSVSATSLTGNFTSNPLEVGLQGDPQGDAQGSTIGPIMLSLKGATPTSEVEGYLPPGWGERLDGRIDWRGMLYLNRPEQPTLLALSSDLAAVTSSLPAPVDRLPAAAAELRLPEEGRIDVGFTLDSLLAGRMLFTRATDTADWRLDRGDIRAGSVEPPDIPTQAGLVVTGRVAELPALDWVLLGSDSEAAKAAGENEEQLLRAVDIAAENFRLGHLEFVGQRISGERLDDTWSFSMQGPIQGAVRLPDEFTADREADLKLEQLHIAGEEEPGGERVGEGGLDDDGTEAKREDRAPDPRKLPSAQLDIGSLKIGDLDFGRVTGRLRRTSIGLVADDLKATGADFNASVSGRWEFVDQAHYTSMNARIESTDLEQTLSRLGYLGGVDADEALITTNLSWPASPAAWDIGILEGGFSFDFEDGQLREVSPGAGRMLGLLSLSALPRRLMLDFSDLFNEGLAYDSLTGEYLITNGNAYTTNVKLEGASITAWLVGRTGLKDRDYDQVAIVDPGVGASIPVAGYLAAGPTVGAALLLASQVLKTPLSDITQVKYRITGSWDDPLIEEVELPQVGRTANEEN